MCNAWNHPPDCQCGWDGEGHIGHSNVVRLGVPANYTVQPVYDSYRNSNSRCRQCNAKVFFYQSPYGGRVFFDEIGPPWPKHSCTKFNPPYSIRREPGDNVASLENNTTPTANSSIPTVKYKWEVTGWKPFVCLGTKVLSTNQVRIHGIFLRDDREPRGFTIHMAKLKEKKGIPQGYHLYVRSTDDWFSGNPLFVRRTDESHVWCEVATFKLDEHTLEVNAVYMRAVIREDHRSKIMDELKN